MGTLDLYLSTIPAYPFGVLGLIAAQRRANLFALERFRPAAGLDDLEYERTASELTHQPARASLILAILFGTLGLATRVDRRDRGVPRVDLNPDPVRAFSSARPTPPSGPPAFSFSANGRNVLSVGGFPRWTQSASQGVAQVAASRRPYVL